MRAGILDRRIVIEKNTPTQDQFGDLTNDWNEFATVWARVAPVTGNEKFVSDQATAASDTLFRIRHLSGLDESMRIVYESKNYDIQNILPIARREGFNILARTKQGQNDS